MSDAEWEMVRRAAALGGEDVAGYLRRLATMNARRRIAAAKGGPQ